MAAKEGVPPCNSCCATEWKAAEYDKKKFEGTWIVEKGSPLCCGKVWVTPHCCCYTCVAFSFCGMPLLCDITWTCGDNCWVSEGGSTYIYGEGDVVYHQWACCPYEKWTRAPSMAVTPTGGAPADGMAMER